MSQHPGDQNQTNTEDHKFFLPVEKNEPLFEIEAVNFMALWGWKSNTDSCAICHESLLSPCVGCNTSYTPPPGKCTIVWSNCSHGYHAHCIKKWIQNRASCPICQSPWIEQPTGE